MRPQYNHDVISSFVMWLDSRLLVTGQAYQNVTGALYQQKVTGVPGWVYASPYKSWVWDSCQPDAAIPSGFYTSSGQFLTRQSGIVLDFINGRVISPHNWGAQLTGIYARKEVNVYFSSPEETNYVLEQVYNSNSNLKYPLTGFQGNALAAPLIMVTNAKANNEQWALGGMDDSMNTIRCFTISNSSYIQEGVNSLINDAAHSYIPLATYGSMPITASGDLKTTPWSYCHDVYDAFGCKNGLYIDNIYSFKLGDKMNKNPTFLISAMDVDVSKPRFPRG